MSTRKLPKTLLHACTVTYAARFDEGWSEQDGWDSPNGWSHWVYLKPGWHNARTDPYPGLHTIHESSVKEAIACLREAKPCNCDDCRNTLNRSK